MKTKKGEHYEVTCPHCRQSFKLTESTYDAIVRAAREEGAESERTLLEDRYEKDIKKAASIARAEANNEHKAELVEMEKQANELEGELRTRIRELESEVKNAEKDKKSALKIQQDENSATIKQLKQEIKSVRDRSEAAAKEAAANKKAAVLEEKAKSQDEIAKLREQLATSRAESEKTKAEAEAALAREKEYWQRTVEDRDKEIKRIEEMKLARTTKMVGEDLEQWCKKEFDKNRARMFQRASFEKNTKAVDHSMGDFIFRECDEDGDEILSIMFEMKNEQQTTGKKKKNEDFFKELDKDRNNHNCEYAILVSMLEPDNDQYDNIYEVYQYEKMFVVRPEFFITIIVLLRNMALDRFGDRKAMLLHERTNVDISNFNNTFEQAAIAFGKTVQHAAKQRSEAIKQLEAIKGAVDKALEALRKEGNHFEVSQKKLEALSPNSLSKGNETIKAMFEEFKQHSLPSGDK